MTSFIRLSLFSCLIFISACSSPQYRVSIQQLENVDLSINKILAVPFFAQEQYQCGPAALSSIFHYRQRPISAETLKDQVYIPDKKGSIQLEMKAAVRRASLLPYPLDGDLTHLLQELDAGNPVLVYQNLGLSFFSQYHYAVAIGYDLTTKTLILHSGTIEQYRVLFATFMNTWQRTGFWALVPVPVEIMPATVNAKDYLRTATELESIGNMDMAYKAYQQALIMWPNDSLARMGAANVLYAQGNYSQAAEHFYRLIVLHPDYANGWNNLAYALDKLGCDKKALAAVAQAVDLSSGSAKVDFQASMTEINRVNTVTKMADKMICQPFEHDLLTK